MGSVDLAGVMNSLPANPLDDQTIALSQMHFRLAHDYTSERRVARSEVYTCSVIYVS